MNESKVALITGANQGIGYAVAQRLAADGMRIVLNGRRADAVLDAARTLAATGADVHPIAADVANEEQVAGMFSEIALRYGRLDVLINNAGIAPRIGGRSARVEETPLTYWQEILATNLTGTFLVSRAAVALMQPRRAGRIVNMASQSGRMYTGFGSAAYAASKAGIIGFSRVLAGEVGSYGITVNCVSPGRIKTAMAASFAGEADIDQRYIARTPLGTVGRGADVAAAVAYLTSDAAAFVTGTIIDVTGGFYMP